MRERAGMRKVGTLLTPLSRGAVPVLRRKAKNCTEPVLRRKAKNCTECRKKREENLQRAAIGHDFSRIAVSSGARPVLQTKLRINEPGDAFEKEAEGGAQLTTLLQTSLNHADVVPGDVPSPYRGSEIYVVPTSEFPGPGVPTPQMIESLIPGIVYPFGIKLVGENWIITTNPVSLPTIEIVAKEGEKAAGDLPPAENEELQGVPTFLTSVRSIPEKLPGPPGFEEWKSAQPDWRPYDAIDDVADAVGLYEGASKILRMKEIPGKIGRVASALEKTGSVAGWVQFVSHIAEGAESWEKAKTAEEKQEAANEMMKTLILDGISLTVSEVSLFLSWYETVKDMNEYQLMVYYQTLRKLDEEGLTSKGKRILYKRLEEVERQLFPERFPKYPFDSGGLTR